MKAAPGLLATCSMTSRRPEARLGWPVQRQWMLGWSFAGGVVAFCEMAKFLLGRLVFDYPVHVGMEGFLAR
jgi:hypothetical protein